MKEYKGAKNPLAVLLRQGTALLRAAGVEGAALDARLLLQGQFGFSHAEIVSGRARALTEAEAALYVRALARRAAHEPVHRILGRRAFYGRDFAMSEETLEPRADTEALVELLLPYIHAAANKKGEIDLPDMDTGNFASPKFAEFWGKSAKQANKPLPCVEPVSLLDIGTGSGIIALTLLAEAPALSAAGADISVAALSTARGNARALGVAARFTAIESDCFQNISGKYDFIASNPPYIPRAEIEILAAEVRLYDPRRALDGGADGLDFYRILAAQSAAHLRAGGRVGVEIGYNQAEAVRGLFTAAGFHFCAARRDLSGIERALLFAL